MTLPTARIAERQASSTGRHFRQQLLCRHIQHRLSTASRWPWHMRRPTRVDAVLQVVASVVGDRRFPPLGPAADNDKAAPGKGRRGRLVREIRPFTIRAPVGDPAQDI